MELVPGSVCTTRTQTGVGVPSPPAIMECPDALNGVGGHIIADGGCTQPGDVAKALGGGAHFVMLGGMLAGHDESELELKDGKRVFYGMVQSIRHTWTKKRRIQRRRRQNSYTR